MTHPDYAINSVDKGMLISPSCQAQLSQDLSCQAQLSQDLKHKHDQPTAAAWRKPWHHSRLKPSLVLHSHGCGAALSGLTATPSSSSACRRSEAA